MVANDPNKTMELALGRIFRMMSRPTQPGDMEEYERCRIICLDAADELGVTPCPSYRPSNTYDLTPQRGA